MQTHQTHSAGDQSAPMPNTQSIRTFDQPTKGDTMKTLKQFTSQSNIPATLIRAVVRKIGGWDSFKDHAEDVSNHGASGGFSGFCYYSDTVKFAASHKNDIMLYANDMARDIGEDSAISLIAGFNCLKMDAVEVAEALYNPRSDERTMVYNALAWFALEEVSRNYCDMVQQ